MGDLEERVEELSYLLGFKKNQENAKRVCLKDRFKYKSEVGGILLKHDSDLYFHIVRSYYDRLIDFSHKFVKTGNRWYANRLIALIKQDIKIRDSEDYGIIQDKEAIELLRNVDARYRFPEKKLIKMCEDIASRIYLQEGPISIPEDKGEKYMEFHVHTGQPPSNADLTNNNELVLSYKLFNNSEEFHFITAYFINNGEYKKAITFR